MVDDLWPDYISSQTSVKAPVTILKEQGALLGEKTSNLVEGQVAQPGDPYEREDRFFHVLYIVGPALSNYRYQLLTVSHPIDLYPLWLDIDESILEELDLHEYIQYDENERAWFVDTQDKFIGTLRMIFATKKVRRVIEAIVAQSGGDTIPSTDASIPF